MKVDTHTHLTLSRADGIRLRDSDIIEVEIPGGKVLIWVEEDFWPALEAGEKLDWLKPPDAQRELNRGLSKALDRLAAAEPGAMVEVAPEEFKQIVGGPGGDPPTAVVEVKLQRPPFKKIAIDPENPEPFKHLLEENPLYCQHCGFLCKTARGKGVHLRHSHGIRGIGKGSNNYVRLTNRPYVKRKGNVPAEPLAQGDPTGTGVTDQATEHPSHESTPDPLRSATHEPDQVKPRNGMLDPHWRDSPYRCNPCSIGFFLKENLLDHQVERHGMKKIA